MELPGIYPRPGLIGSSCVPPNVTVGVSSYCVGDPYLAPSYPVGPVTPFDELPFKRRTPPLVSSV